MGFSRRKIKIKLYGLCELFYFVYLCRKCGNGAKKNKADSGIRVAFRTKSDLEVMDDGLKGEIMGRRW